MIENIDIGGPSMIRSAAKNFKDVLIVTDPKDYDNVLDAIKNDTTDFDFRMNLAYKAFSMTGAYDAMISSYFARSSWRSISRYIKSFIKESRTFTLWRKLSTSS